MFKRLQLKMTLTYTGILILVLLLTNLSIYFVMEKYNRYQLMNETEQMLRNIQTTEWLFSGTTSGDDHDEDDKEGEKGAVTPTIEGLVIPTALENFPFFVLYDENGRLVRYKGSELAAFNELNAYAVQLAPNGNPVMQEIQKKPEQYYLISRMTIQIENQEIGTYAVARDVTSAYETMANLLKILVFSFLIGIGLSAVLGYFLAGRSLRPIIDAYNSKQSFLENASHELRTPLSVMLLSTEILQNELEEKTDLEFVKETVEGIKDETKKMSGLVEQLMFIARSDGSGNHYKKESLNFSDLVTTEAARFENMAVEKGITLRVKVEPGIFFLGDGSLLRSFVSIFIDNGLKYTEKGGELNVLLEMSRHRAQGRFDLKFQDTGIGIPSEALGKLFERFYRVEGSRSKETGGYGLGLAIAKEIAELHGAQLTVKSEVGKGTEFTVHF